MGLVELLLFIAIVVGLSWFVVRILGQFFAGHPVIIDKVIWGVAIVVILMKVFHAFGLSGYDPQIPQF